MPAKPTRPLPIMLNRILIALSRRWQRAGTTLPVQPWINDDFSWHSSSFELARGLEVIEHRGDAPSVFVDTLPAFQRAEA